MKLPLPARGLARFRVRQGPGPEKPGPEKPGPAAPDYSRLLTGEAALTQLYGLPLIQAQELLSACAAALSLYPAWERRD